MAVPSRRHLQVLVHGGGVCAGRGERQQASPDGASTYLGKPRGDMDGLPRELCLKIFHLLDHQSLASSPQGLTRSLKLWHPNTELEAPVIAIAIALPLFFLFQERNFSDDEININKVLASQTFFSKLFNDRWGADAAAFYAPEGSKSWKDVFAVQDRCDRYGLGVRIIREGKNYYLIYQGEIQRYLGKESPSEDNQKFAMTSFLTKKNCQAQVSEADMDAMWKHPDVYKEWIKSDKVLHELIGDKLVTTAIAIRK
ncbi:OsFBX59 - F-box domain containing protein expressed, partial [Zea mays]